VSARLAALQQRRLALLERAAAQRQVVCDVAAAWLGPLSVVDRALAVLRQVSASPLTIPASALLTVWLKRWRWATPLLSAWHLATSFRRGGSRQSRSSH